MDSKNLTYIDFFSGCGGLSLGLGLADWNGIFAIEKDPMAYSSFDHNLVDEKAPYRHFKHWPTWLSRTAHSIEDVLENPEVFNHFKKMAGTVTLVAGGPPCQGFSVAGARNGNDPRNLLVFKQIKAIEILKPMFAIIENVEGFEKKFVNRPVDDITLSVAEEAMHELKNIGYNVGKVVINAADYGVPQIRKRVILFAISKEYIDGICVDELLKDILQKVSVSQREELNLPQNRYVTVEEALNDLYGGDIVEDPEFPNYKTCKYRSIDSSYQTLMRKHIKNDIPTSHRFNKHGTRIVELYQKAISTQPPGRISKEFLFANGCHSNKRYVLDLKKPCSTVTTAPEELIHFHDPRCVTLREMARLQSFPDDFSFYGRYTLNGPSRGKDVPRNAQIGNAIPPLVGRALGKSLETIYSMLINKDEKLQEYKYRTDPHNNNYSLPL